MGNISACCLLLVTGCAMLPDSQNLRIRPSHAASIVQQGQTVSLPPGVATEISRVPSLIEAPGKVSILLLYPDRDANIVDVTMRPLDEWGGNAFEAGVSDAVDEVVQALSAAQSHLAEGRASECVQRLSPISTKLHSLRSVRILFAHCLLALGKKTEAIQQTQLVLEKYPTDTGARALYLQMVGREYSSEDTTRRAPATEGTP